MTVIDAHQHFWRVAHAEHPWRTAAHAAIDRDFEPRDLRAERAAAGVDATVLVQSADTAEENERLAAYARAEPAVAGVVGWLPLHDPARARLELERLAEVPRLVGVRCLVAHDPLEWLDGLDVRRLFAELAARGLTWDVVVVTGAQVDAVCRLAAALGDLRIVVDHLARPPLDGGSWDSWSRSLAALARLDSVALKVSVGIDVLSSWERWSAPALVRAVAEAVSRFGPGRLMLASNWPVVLLRRSYVGAWRDLEAALAAAGVRGQDRAAVAGATAERWYDLEL